MDIEQNIYEMRCRGIRASLARPVVCSVGAIEHATPRQGRERQRAEETRETREGGAG